MAELSAYKNRDAVEAHGTKVDSVVGASDIIGGANVFILVGRESGTAAALHDNSTILPVAPEPSCFDLEYVYAQWV